MPWGSWLASEAALGIASSQCSCSQLQPGTAHVQSPSLAASPGRCFLLAALVPGSSHWPGLVLAALLIALGKLFQQGLFLSNLSHHLFAALLVDFLASALVCTEALTTTPAVIQHAKSIKTREKPFRLSSSET